MQVIKENRSYITQTRSTNDNEDFSLTLVSEEGWNVLLNFIIKLYEVLTKVWGEVNSNLL